MALDGVCASERFVRRRVLGESDHGLKEERGQGTEIRGQEERRSQRREEDGDDTFGEGSDCLPEGV